MQIVSNGDNLHEMSNPIFWKKQKYFDVLSAENFTQSARLNRQSHFTTSIVRFYLGYLWHFTLITCARNKHKGS